MDPLLYEFEVDCGVSHAFETWTARVSTWWPRDHTLGGHSDVEVVSEAGVGGRIYERHPDGTEHNWGEFLLWEPPSRLVYLWHIGSGRDDATEVEITFSEADAGTIVQIEHRGWERLGAGAGERRTTNKSGWGALTPHYISACRVASSDIATSGGLV